MPRAPRRCPGGGGTCDELIVGSARYCPTHTVAWKGERTASSRVTTTRAWRILAPKILERDDYRCQIRYPNVCVEHATTVDKIQPASKRPDLALEPANLRAACRPCNEHKGRTDDRQPKPFTRRP